MNFVICPGNINAKPNANNNIAENVAKELAECGHKVIYVDFLDDYEKDIDKNLPIEVIRVCKPKNYDVIFDKKELCKKRKRGLIKFILANPIESIKLTVGKKLSINNYIKAVNKIIEKNADSYLIAFYRPFETIYKLSKAVNTEKMIAYQLDPWGMHELLPSKEKEKRISQETEVFSKSKLIVTTNLLYEQYIKTKDYEDYKAKMIPCYFPVLKESHEKSKKTFEEGTINICYLGTIDDRYRNPKKIIDFVINLNKKYNFNIQMYFFGKTYCKYVTDVSKTHEEIHVCGCVSREEANKIMNSNCMLLNINNTITNQMPSKIMEYISTGNPIINIIKSENDTTKKLLENYENAFHIDETRDIKEEDFVSFINTKANSKIPYVKIASNYYMSTPEYVVQEITKAISGHSSE